MHCITTPYILLTIYNVVQLCPSASHKNVIRHFVLLQSYSNSEE